jgi:nicotinamidase-related amidase
MTEGTAAAGRVSAASAAEEYLRPQFESAALITIDTQCDVLDGAPLEIAGTSQALPAMSSLLEAFRRAGGPVVHVVRLYREDGSNVDLCRRAAVERGARMFAPGDAGAELAPALRPPGAPPLDADLLLAGAMQPLGPGEDAMYKPRWGAFFQTPLEQHLREREVSTLVFCGCNFPNCPRTSIYQASERDFRVVLAADAISGLYEQGRHELAAIGVRLMAAADVAAAVSALAARATLGA